MKWVILHTETQVMYQQQLPSGTRPIYNADIYTLREFDTEAEMNDYIAEHNLVVNNETE